jgi:hypothetical protein
MMPNLPDLDAAADTEIVKENVHAVQAIYYAYMLEELRLFQVVDRIVELYTQGQLPLGRGRAGELLYRYWRSSGERLTADERAGFYARALGAPGGSATDVQPNYEFISLFMRFLAAVSTFARQQGVDDIARPTPPGTVSTATVRDAARALAVNASQYGGGMVLHAARKLSEQVKQIVQLLGDPELLQAFGARDMWQVIDQVNRNHLGGARNVVRYRTQADAGSRVLEWLAAHADQLNASQIEPDGFAVDADLLNAVEQWLAVGGVADTTVEETVEEAVGENSQPAEPPAMKRPVIDMPALAQDLLSALGLTAMGKESKASEGTAGSASDSTQSSPGLVALFHGAAGTGKTLAAHVLAQALGRDILRVDLAQVVSKYIGETEKNLAALLDRAERTGAVLFLDEADALFGKRTEVKDAHDRYANADIAYLLQRIEAYEGLIILATNVQDQNGEAKSTDDWRRRLRRRVRFPRG